MNSANHSSSRLSKLGISSEALERTLILNDSRRKLKDSLLWGTINAFLLAIVLYEIIYTCPIKRASLVLYIEYILAILFTFNIMYYIIRYLVVSAKCEATNDVSTPLEQHSPQQLSLLAYSPYQSTPNNTFSNVLSTSINNTLHNRRSNSSTFASSNISSSPTPFSYTGNTPQFIHHYSANSSPSNVSFQDASKAELTSDEHCLAEYLKGYEVYDRSASNTDGADQQVNVGNSFWSYPSASTKDTPNILRRCQYQVSPVTPASSSSSPGSQSDDTSPLNSSTIGMEIWRQFNVDKIALTQWNANIRTWIFQTIIGRLVKEIDNIDDLLQKHNLSDIKVGYVGIERLRKTAEMALVLQTIPTLSILLPFLEICANQEYFVKRLRELAKGGCLSDFKWNSGSSFLGREWNDSLPTDSEIIMHLFATYMDTQLLPNPNNPDIKPFTGYHYIKYSDKMPVLTPNTLAIQQFLNKPPQYRVIVGGEIFELMKGYNNLFHSILLFLYHVNKREHGMLGRINLGRAGVNIMWVIDS